MSGSFIDPKLQAEEQERAEWQQEWHRSVADLQTTIEHFATMTPGVPNDMIFDVRIRCLVEFLLPAHISQETDPFDPHALENAPTNIERLQYDTMWRDRLNQLVTDILQQMQEQAVAHGMPAPNGKPSGLIIAQPGEAAAAAEEIMRKAREN